MAENKYKHKKLYKEYDYGMTVSLLGSYVQQSTTVVEWIDETAAVSADRDTDDQGMAELVDVDPVVHNGVKPSHR